MKKESKKIRNPFAVLAKNRKGGRMKSKKDKRKNGKNPQKEFVDNENYER